MYRLYNALLTPLYPILGLYTLHRRFVRGRSAQSLAGQWGRVSPEMRAFGRSEGPRLWIHAVSVGEMMAARPILRALKAQMPTLRIALSCTTDTGFQLAASTREADVCFYFPLDLPVPTSRVLNALRPQAIGFVETELWPNLLHAARGRKIETFLLNGRVSDNMNAQARRFRPVWKWMSDNVGAYLMRNEEDAARLRALGVAGEKIEVTGDVKLDAPPTSAAETRLLWRNRLGLKDEKLLVAGSTHAGEETLILEALQTLGDSWRLALAPRHIERADEVVRIIENAGFQVARRSKNEKLDENSVFLLDSVGELAELYAAGEVAFVGGTLIARGGHNLLEPVQRGVPVVFGASVDNFRSAAEMVLKQNLGAMCEAEALASQVEKWASVPRATFADRTENVLAPHRGAAKKMARRIVETMSG